ncbi:MAG: hypothetical protein Q9218_007607, partial [Villophora microphyllina]
MPHDGLEQCKQEILTFTSSPYANEIGYRQRVHKSPAGKRKRSDVNDLAESSSFPAPLVLPGDDLALDPKYPPQSLLSWQRLKERNMVTRRRNVIYVAAPPDIDPAVEIVGSWIHPKNSKQKARSQRAGSLNAHPDVKDIVDYISAFYHGLPVKLLPSALVFGRWEDESPPSKSKASKRKGKDEAAPTSIGLRTASENIRIRTRASPDSVYPSQLNLDDLLDVAISVLPSDAYALLLLVSHDLYEDDDDIFVCGRAYGGSRVAVISTARYDPYLDD